MSGGGVGGIVATVTGHCRFGLFDFDPGAGTLSKQGVPQRLQPQPARMLAILLERPGEVVTRDTLRQRIWADGTSVDFERGLNFCVAQIRSALGDSADTPRYIETLPRRGYRFIAPVTPVDAEPASARRGVRERRRSIAAVGALLLVIAALAAAVATGLHSWPSRIRVAVLPFDNETGDESFDRVAVAVSDATVARLVAADRDGRLSVIGNSAALRRPRAFRDLKAIARDVQADYIVLAQMKADAAGVRLIAHLIRSEDEAHVWAATFDRPAATLDAQARIAEAVAAAVTSRLLASGQP